MITVALVEPISSAVAGLIEKIHAQRTISYLVMADRAIADARKELYADGYGPVDEAADCWDDEFTHPMFDVR
jgi:hypothetical protein